MRIVRPSTLRRLVAVTAAVAVAPVVIGTSAASFGSPSDISRSADAAGDLVGPDQLPVVHREVDGDMFVDWLEEPPTDGSISSGQSDGHEDHGDHGDHGDEPVDPDGTTSVYEAASPSGGASGTPGQGFATMSASARWLPGGYTIRITGGDGRIEQFRDEFAAAAQGSTAAGGRPVRLAPAFGGPANPARGEILVVLGYGPCGSQAWGCGGPAIKSGEIVSGRVWISPSALRGNGAQRMNLAAHELAHTLGLSHYSGSWTDGRQTMHPTVSSVSSYRDGDRRGLRYMSGADEKPAGSIASLSYAAGQVSVNGSLASGSKVRLSVGATTRDLTSSGGGFSGVIPAGAGSQRVCATSLDAARGFTRSLGCSLIDAPGTPFGGLEVVAGSFETIRIAGWAADPQTAAPIDVQVRRNGSVVATVKAAGGRPDVAQKRPAYGAAHGFDFEVPAVAGANDICVRFIGVGGGGDKDKGCRRITHAVDPVGGFAATVNGLGVTVDGWALDPNTPAAVNVRASIDGSAQPTPGSFSASGHQPGGNPSYPAHGDKHGFSQLLVLPAGEHDLCLTVVNVGLGQDRSLGCTTVRVDPAVALTKSVASLGASTGLAPVMDSVNELLTGVLGG